MKQRVPFKIAMAKIAAAMIFSTIILSGLLANSARAAPGEYWVMSIVTKMDEAPFPTPAHHTKLCLANGALDPNRLQAKDEDCALTDIQNIGNKVSWKYKCVVAGNRGTREKEIMEGPGEATKTRDMIIGATKISGMVGAEMVGMSITYNGKRTKEKCDL